MATSGSKTVEVTSWNDLVFEWSVVEQPAGQNYSRIHWTLKLVAGSSGRIDSSVAKAYSVTVNGTTQRGTTSIAVANNATRTLAAGYNAITHDADGNKTFNYSFSQTFDITFSGSSIGTISGSGTGDLPRINRASTLSVPALTIGSSATLTVTRQLDSNKHRLYYTVNGVKTYIAGSDSTFSTSTSITWTPPNELAALNPNGSSVSSTSFSLILATYTSAGALVAIKSYGAALTIPNTDVFKPTASMSLSDAAGYAATYGYLKGLSTLEISFNGSAGVYGSSIKKNYAYVECFGKYTSSGDGNTTHRLNHAGEWKITGRVYDSRGRQSANITRTITVLEYTRCTINTLTVHRCAADGTENGDGDYVKATFNAAGSGVGTAKPVTVRLQYKKSSETTYTDATLGSGLEQSCVFPADSANSYDVLLTVTDGITEATKQTSASTAFTLMHWSADGKSLGIGKVAEIEGLDVGMRARFAGGFYNIVLDKYNDLNDVLIPNTYVSVNKGATEYENCPIASGTFVLEVMSAGAEGQAFQRLTSTFKEGAHQKFERHYYQGTWGSWVLVYSDTGWLDLTLQSGISYGTEMGYLKGRLKNGVLYIKGDVKGISASWKYFALAPAALCEGLASPNRFTGLYDMSYLCGFNLQSGGQLYVSSNSAGAWDATKNVSVNVAICI